MKDSVLIIYTGGTIGSLKDPSTGALRPFEFDRLREHVPELNRFSVDLPVHAFDTPVDSSNMGPEAWARIARVIAEQYHQHDGFVILQGTDTMAYSASALSFMLEGLDKPVILTGSQLPMGVIRTDGKENIITAIEIASGKGEGKVRVPEVAIYFEFKLYRGNRTHKFNADHFQAFRSPNYPLLAEAGVTIEFDQQAIAEPGSGELELHTEFDANVLVLRLFPGIAHQMVAHLLSIPGLRGVVLETFGSGNAMTDRDFLRTLKEAIDRGVLVLNVTQCPYGFADQSVYETGQALQDIGVVEGRDMTTEAGVSKLMHLLGAGQDPSTIRASLQRSLRGEMTPRKF